MPEVTMRVLLLVAALVSCTVGFAWLALAMEGHWAQVRGSEALSPGLQRILRVLGVLALAAALVLCLSADHASMAVLVWVMALAAGALMVTFTLTWRARWLAPLVAWSRLVQRPMQHNAKHAD